MIKIGDRVKFLNDTSVGYVTKIEKDIVYVDVEDGFNVPTLITDLVVVQEEDEIEAIKKIGVSDERPGRKKGAPKSKTNNTEKEPPKREAYANYGKISLIDRFSGRDDDDDEDYDDDVEDYDDSYLDLDRIHEQYVRNKIAAQEKAVEFDKARERAELERQSTIEASSVTVGDSTVFGDERTEETTENAATQKKAMERVAVQELAEKLKMDLPKAPTVNVPKSSKNADMEIVDLHAQEILDTTFGMTSGEIIKVQLARFTVALDLAIGSGRHGKIVFIHGVGTGRLKYEMNKILSSKYPKLVSQDASFREYGYGAILVIY